MALVPVLGLRSPPARPLRLPKLLERERRVQRPAFGTRVRDSPSASGSSRSDDIHRPRFRTYTVASIGAELESLLRDPTRHHAATPFLVLPRRQQFYPAIVASAGWSNAQRPGLSISPEDGISISVSGRQRWQCGHIGGATRTAIGVTSAYKSLDLPGFAHHVLALRAAGGISRRSESRPFLCRRHQRQDRSRYSPACRWDSSDGLFGVRGYSVGSEAGRSPIPEPSSIARRSRRRRGDSVSFRFSSTGRRLPSSVRQAARFALRRPTSWTAICTVARISNPVMSSAGAEINIDTGLQLDLQARLRGGIAFPLANREELGAGRVQIYGTFGASF